MRNVLITGGAGFIGSSVADKLLQNGDRVVVVDNFDPFYAREIKENNVVKALSSPNFKLIEGDIRDSTLVADLISTYDIEVVIHLAAKAGVRPSLENPEEYYDVNINGTLCLLECMRKAGVNKMVFASSSSVYGNNRETPFHEEHIVDFPISPYASTKKSGELLCHVYSHLYNFKICCLRFFTVYGPRQRPDLAIHKFTELIDNNLPIPFYGDGSTSRDYTYIDDIVDGVVSASQRLATYNIFNLGGSSPISLKELVEKIAENVGKRPVIDRRPMQPGDVDLTYGCIDKAREFLDYNPKVSIDEGLRKFVKWFHHKNRINAAHNV